MDDKMVDLVLLLLLVYVCCLHLIIAADLSVYKATMNK